MSSEDNEDKILLVFSSLFNDELDKEEDQAVINWQMNDDDELYNDSDAQNSASEYDAENHHSVTPELQADSVIISSDRTVTSAISS